MQELRTAIASLQLVVDFANSPIVPAYPNNVDTSLYDVTNIEREIANLNALVQSITQELATAERERDQLTAQIETVPPPENVAELISQRDEVNLVIASKTQELADRTAERDGLVAQRDATLAALDAALAERESIYQQYLQAIITREQEVEAAYAPQKIAILEQGGAPFAEGLQLAGWDPQTISPDGLLACLRNTLQILLSVSWSSTVQILLG